MIGATRQAPRGFLDLLAGCLDDGDTVLLAGPRPKSADPRSWRTVSAGKLVRGPQVPAWHPTVVVLDERVVPVGPWVTALERALDDPNVGAAAARTNIAAGDELLVGVPYRPDEGGLHRRFARERARESAVTDADCLSGPSIALRYRDFRAADGLAALAHADPVGELARRIATRGQRLVVAEGAYLHNGGGHAPRALPGGPGARSCGAPLVSACLIVKDEEKNLPRCLPSLDGFADEVVVYDTGSTDSTREIARAHGATVVDGYWDGDFARARNAALAHCRGQWIFWIDADEALECEDRPAARLKLAETPATVEGFIVLIDNLRGTKASTSLAHPACRLFRRAYAQWEGRLHEQVRPRTGMPTLHTALIEELRIAHWGYLHATVDEKHKGRRNVRSAFADVVGETAIPWEARLVNLARSYGLDDQPEAAIDLCRAALDGAPSPRMRRYALQTLVDSLLRLGRAEEALGEIEALRRASATSSAANLRQGKALLALGRLDDALAAFERVTLGIDEDGFEFGIQDVAVGMASALFKLERDGTAADVLLECLRVTGGMDVAIATLLAALERAGRPATEIAAAVPPDRAVAFLGQLVHLAAVDADRVLEAWEEAAPSLAVLATASRIAGRLPVHRQLVWSTRLRAKGLVHACPLVAAVGDPGRPVTARLLGAALAAHLWADLRGRQAVVALAATLDAEGRATVRAELASVAPSLLDVLDGVDPLATRHVAQLTETASSESAGRRVLLVDCQPAGIRTMALAVLLARAGHHVTVTWPSCTRAGNVLLERAGVTLRHWTAPSVIDDEGWRRAVTGAVATAYAATSFDTVVLAEGAGAVLDEARARVPGAVVLADPGEEVVPGSITDLYDPSPPVPWEVRTGVVVVGDFVVGGGAAVARFEREIAPALRRHLGTLPVCVVGFDPEDRIAASLPGAVTTGPLDNPLPWLRAARTVLVATDAGAPHWLAAAALAGTPACGVPPGTDGQDALDACCRMLATLADPHAQIPPTLRAVPDASDALHRRAIRHDAGHVTDLLAALTSFTVASDAEPSSNRSDESLVEVRTGVPPDLSARRSTCCVVELPWGYASIPVEWIGGLRDAADEVWAPGTWGARVLEATGVEAQKVQVVAPGIDTIRFAPERAPFHLQSTKGVRLLFVGDCDEASGIDALLEAYYLAFGSAEDVCLVVHPTGIPSARTFEPDVRRAADGAPGRPAVEVVEGPLTDGELAGLYRACDALVHPHRAAGSPEVVLAAMASGRPVVTLSAGVGADVCDERTGWLVPCHLVPTPAPAWLPVTRTLRQLEPKRAALADALRAAVGSPDERLKKGLAARERSVSTYALDVAATARAARLERLTADSDRAPALHC